jgi:hypothetical protein
MLIAKRKREMNDLTRTPHTSDLSDQFRASARPILTVDVERYQALLDGSGLSDEQKEEFLQALWSIVVSFVEHGFGVHPLQEICGQDDLGDTHEPAQSRDLIDSLHGESKKLE